MRIPTKVLAFCLITLALFFQHAFKLKALNRVMYPDNDMNNYDLHWYDRRHIYQIYELLWEGL